MRIPHTICINTVKTYSTAEDYKNKVKQTLRADDLTEWDKNIPKKLTDICVEVIAENWTSK